MAGKDEQRPRRRRGASGPGRRASVVIHRARDRGPPEPAAPAPPLPSLEALRAPEGRAVLEGLLRRCGARPASLCRALSEGWRRADGAPPGEVDLRALLDVHGMLRAFERRERGDALHALRAAGGALRRAAASLELAPEALEALLARTGASAEAEALRRDRRGEILKSATLSERARLLLAEAERLEDLGALAEIEADLARRIPEHLRALPGGSAAERAAALGRTLSLGRDEVAALARRLGLDLGAGAPAAQPARPVSRGPAARPPGRPRPPRRPGPRRRRPL